MEDLKKRVNPDANITRGLGVFGNNIGTLKPKCLSSKYHSWIQVTIHSDREMPLYRLSSTGKKLKWPKETNRAYCCCTNMRTGEVFDNDPEKNCVYMAKCVDSSLLACKHAFDPEAGKEIFEGMEAEDNRYL